MSIANEAFINKSNAYENADTATCEIAAFVTRHETTLKYIQLFGSPLERAKVNILIKIALGMRQCDTSNFHGKYLQEVKAPRKNQIQHRQNANSTVLFK